MGSAYSLDHSICDSRSNQTKSHLDEQVIHNILYALLCSHSFWHGKDILKGFVKSLRDNTKSFILPTLLNQEWECSCYSEYSLQNDKRPDFVFEITGTVQTKIALELKWAPKNKEEWLRAQNQIIGYSNQSQINLVIVLIHEKDFEHFKTIDRNNSKICFVFYEGIISKWLEGLIKDIKGPFDMEELHLASQIFALYSIINPTKKLPRTKAYNDQLQKIFTELNELCRCRSQELYNPYRIIAPNSFNRDIIKNKAFFEIIYKNNSNKWYSISIREDKCCLFFEFKLVTRREAKIQNGKANESFCKIANSNPDYKKLRKEFDSKSFDLYGEQIKYRGKPFVTDFRFGEKELIWPWDWPRNIAKEVFEQLSGFAQNVHQTIKEL